MALILGHSQVKYMHQYLVSDKIVTLCYPGYQIRDFLDIKLVAELVPSFPVVVILAGANDLPYSDEDTATKDLQELCEKIRSYNPSATVMVCSILPREQNLHPGERLTNKFLTDFNEVANEVNRRLHVKEQHVPWMKFLQIPGFVSASGINRRMLARDGLHLSFTGTEHAASAIEGAINMLWRIKERVQRRIVSIKPAAPPTASPEIPPSVQPEPAYLASQHDFIGPRLYSDVARINLPDSSLTTDAPVTERPTTLTTVKKKQIPSLFKRTPSAPERPSQPCSKRTNKWFTVNMTTRRRPKIESAPRRRRSCKTSTPVGTATQTTSSRKPSITPVVTSPPVRRRHLQQNSSPVVTATQIPSSKQTTSHISTKPSNTPVVTSPLVRRRRPQKTSSVDVYVIETPSKFTLSTDVDSPILTKCDSTITRKCFEMQQENVTDQTENVKLVGGGNEVPFFSETNRFLTNSEAADILHQDIKDSVTTEPPYRPMAGKVYLYSDEGDKNKKDDWKADGYTWRNYGTKRYICEGMELRKLHLRL